MQLNYIPVYGLFVLLNVQLFSTYPITDGLTNSDIDVLKDLLHRLEEVVPKQNEAEPVPAAGGLSLDRVNMEEEAAAEAEAVEEELQRRTRLDEAAIREFLSAKNLKNVRNDSTSRRSSSSGCFGRRMDRIGSMSSLGCNTVGKYSTKRR